MTNAKWEEQIIVVPTDKLFEEVEKFQGVLTDEKDVATLSKAIEDNFSVMRRGNNNDPTPKENNAEINTDFKQPIPYILLRRGNELYCTERLEGAGESRLHKKISLGIGGHMNKTADTFKACVSENAYRELDEELKVTPSLDGYFTARTIGYVNDEKDKVSHVHICILMELELDEGFEVEIKETEELRGFWSTIDELKEKYYDRLEEWSKIAVTHIDPA